MRGRVDYQVIRRPSNTVPGRTNIVFHRGDKNNAVEMGYIEKVRGAEFFNAYVKSSDDEYLAVTGDFKTRSQAGHEIYREYKKLHGNVEVPEPVTEDVV